MRIPFPDNVTWENHDRVVLPPGLVVIWHGNAVEVPDGTPAAEISDLRAALLAFDPKAPTPLEQAAAEARERMAGDAKQADVHTRLLLLEMAAGLVTYPPAPLPPLPQRGAALSRREAALWAAFPKGGCALP